MKCIRGTFETELETEVEYIVLKTEEGEIVVITEELDYIEVNKFKNEQEFIKTFCLNRDESEYLKDYINDLQEEIVRLNEHIKEQDILLESLEE